MAFHIRLVTAFFIVSASLTHWCILSILMRYLPVDVWPKRLYRTVRDWWARNRLPLKWRWNAFRSCPKRTVERCFTFWMVWRIRPATACIGKITCRACGLRATAIRAPEPDAVKSSIPSEYRHVIQFLPAAKKIVALCGRCQATWPEDPIYAAEGWLPTMPPQPKTKGATE